jgi:predicted transcriptional regulator
MGAPIALAVVVRNPNNWCSPLAESSTTNWAAAKYVHAKSMGEAEVETSNSVELAAEVVAAFISNNPLPKSELPALIHAVHSALELLGKVPENAPLQVELKAPAVSVRKSIKPDYLICLEDGKRFKSLRRHLKLHGLTPEQYREKWNLRPDYPMVAPNYAALRSAMAKKIGLGQIRSRPGKGAKRRKDAAK